MSYFLTKKNFCQAIVLNRGGGFYDMRSIVIHLIKRRKFEDKFWLILNGIKRILMTFMNLKLLDSYLYIPRRALPEAYGIYNRDPELHK